MARRRPPTSRLRLVPAWPEMGWWVIMAKKLKGNVARTLEPLPTRLSLAEGLGVGETGVGQEIRPADASKEAEVEEEWTESNRNSHLMVNVGFTVPRGNEKLIMVPPSVGA